MDTVRIITWLLASGGLLAGLAALWQAWNDRKKGVENHEIQEQDISTKTFVETIGALQSLNTTLQTTVKQQGETLETQAQALAELKARQDSYEEKLDNAEDQIKNLTGIKEVLQAHIEVLNDHIEKQLPPPPPIIDWRQYIP